MGNARFEPSINHAMLIPARQAFNECLGQAIDKAIRTGAMEGSATLKVSFEMMEILNTKTSEYEIIPQIKFKASSSVPIKESVEGKIAERATVREDKDWGWILVNNQINMDEIISGEAKE